MDNPKVLEFEILETDIGIFTDNKALRLTAKEVYEKELKRREQIDICPTKTLEERLEEAEQKLAESEEEKKLLKAQVEANASSYEFLESCVMEMAGKVYA